jgi:hypothetical protein
VTAHQEVPQPDLAIHNWDDIAADFVGDEPMGALIIGNGLSRAIWAGFSYPSLYEEASDWVEHPLSGADKAIFAGLATMNFEAVLDAVRKAAVIAAARGEDTDALEEHYHRIRRSLVEAVKSVHVPWDWLSEASRKAIGDAMHRHASVYTISYDLIAYWSMVASGITQFIDYFFAPGHSFDARWLPSAQGRTRMFFVHGALHLVRRWSGVVAKLTNDGRNLLDQFGEEPQAEPLFVSEGSADEKRAAIASSEYLAYAYEQLANDPGPFVLFGVGLAEQDKHIASALNRHGVWIAVGLHGDDPAALLADAARYVHMLHRANVVFFRSSTHPLGDPALHAVEGDAPVDIDEDAMDEEYDDLYDELFGDEWPR